MMRRFFSGKTRLSFRVIILIAVIWTTMLGALVVVSNYGESPAQMSHYKGISFHSYYGVARRFLVTSASLAGSDLTLHLFYANYDGTGHTSPLAIYLDSTGCAQVSKSLSNNTDATATLVGYVSGNVVTIMDQSSGVVYQEYTYPTGYPDIEGTNSIWIWKQDTDNILDDAGGVSKTKCIQVCQALGISTLYMCGETDPIDANAALWSSWISTCNGYGIEVYYLWGGDWAWWYTNEAVATGMVADLLEYNVGHPSTMIKGICYDYELNETSAPANYPDSWTTHAEAYAWLASTHNPNLRAVEYTGQDMGDQGMKIAWYNDYMITDPGTTAWDAATISGDMSSLQSYGRGNIPTPGYAVICKAKGQAYPSDGNQGGYGGDRVDRACNVDHEDCQVTIENSYAGTVQTFLTSDYDDWYQALANVQAEFSEDQPGPGTNDFTAGSGDGYLYNTGAVYATVQSASTTPYYETSLDRLYVGQDINTGVAYDIYRTMMYFDTSSIPSNAIISSATLCLYGRSDISATNFDFTIVDGSDCASSLTGADYGVLLGKVTSGGSLSTASWTTSGYNEINLNTTGLGWIEKGDTTQLGLRSSRDISATGNSGTTEYVSFYSSNSSSNKPYLHIEYTYSSTYSCSTDPADSVTSITATLHGTVEAATASVSGRFQYGLTSSYGTSTTWASGLDAEDTFAADITSLMPNTTYHFCAQIKDGDDTIYSGSDRLLVTLSEGGEPAELGSVGNFSAGGVSIPGGGPAIRLNWSMAPGSTSTVILYTTDHFPVKPDEPGALTAFSGVGTTADVTGLTLGPTYWFSAWGSAMIDGATKYSANPTTKSTTADIQGMAPPDSMTLNDVKVFWNYESATDQLFVVSYSIIYNNGNPTQNVTDYFILQIWDGSVLKAQVPVNFYGYRPASVYLLYNSDTGHDPRLTWNGTYQVVLAGRASRWNTPPVSSSYVLSSGDWIGVDLEQLDTWCLNLADAMGSADGASYTTFIQAYGEVLNADGGKIFSKAIPGLETVRPDLFINGVSALDIPSASAELSHTYEETLTTANMGANASEALDDLGGQLGVSGKVVGGLLFFGLFILCLGGVSSVASTQGNWGGIAGALACLPLIWLGFQFGVISLSLLGIAGMICIIWMGVTFWLART